MVVVDLNVLVDELRLQHLDLLSIFYQLLFQVVHPKWDMILIKIAILLPLKTPHLNMLI